MQITWQQEGNSIEVGSASNYFDQADPCTQAWESGNKWESELTLTYYHDCQTNIWPYRDTKVCWAFVGKLIKPCKLWQQLRTWKCLYHPPKDSIAYVYTHIHTQTHTFSLSLSLSQIQSPSQTIKLKHSAHGDFLYLLSSMAMLSSSARSPLALSMVLSPPWRLISFPNCSLLVCPPLLLPVVITNRNISVFKWTEIL